MMRVAMDCQARARRAVSAFVLAALLAGGASLAYAEGDAVSCEVLEVKASHGDTDRLDPRLRAIEGKLKKPPFSDWNVFESLGAHEFSAQRRHPVEISLAPGGELGLLFQDVMRSDGKKPRLRLSLTLDDAEGKRLMDATIQLDSGDWYLVGGQSMDDGAVYVLAASCDLSDD